jgi:predicted transcriptional regulator
MGPLEAAVMRIVWDRGPVTVRDVYEELRLRRTLAYTTVMTTMSALTSKGLVRRARNGRAFVYAPAVSDVEVARAMLDAVVDVVMGGRVAPLLEHLRGRARPGNPVADGRDRDDLE